MKFHSKKQVVFDLGCTIPGKEPDGNYPEDPDESLPDIPIV